MKLRHINHSGPFYWDTLYIIMPVTHKLHWISKVVKDNTLLWCWGVWV